MSFRYSCILFLSLVLAGCAIHKDVYQGVYLPNCMALEGDRIELREGGFTWDRFTDQRRMDESGYEIDLFPQFPKSGDYQMQGGHVSFALADGAILDTRYFLEKGEAVYLLTRQEDQVIAEGGQIPECALRRIDE